ncbi:DUF2262 domain-containing protein [Terribacillus saccharophilus]|uniref:DUF2262 domain-containing protein n=1 Tax=Terribacillus saccharophilus TaxID=361277 RepID=UPI003981EF6B
MGKLREIKSFEKRFLEETIEIAAVTGSLGAGAGRGGKEVMWTASISLAAWKELHDDAPVVHEKTQLQWLVTDEEWKEKKFHIEPHSIVRLQVRKSDSSLMLVDILSADHKDPELQLVLEKELEPVYYLDEKLGKFELDKGLDWFEMETDWAGKPCFVYVDAQDEESQMKEALQTAYLLFQDPLSWDKKIKDYAASQLLELANDWLADFEDDAQPITKESFVQSITFESIHLYPGGTYEVFLQDGDMFGGHVIIVRGYQDATFESADIAG